MVPLWRRPEVARLVLRRLQRQRMHRDVRVLCVGSEGDASRSLAIECGAEYTEVANEPLGAKFNHGLQATRGLNPYGVMVLGSDNMVSDEYLDLARCALAAGEGYIGLRDGYVYEHEWDTLTHWPGYTNYRTGEPLGSGRCFSRSLLDRLNWKLWDDDAERSLDRTATERLIEAGARPTLVSTATDGVAHLGIRTIENLSMNVTGTKVSPEFVDQVFGPGVRALPRIKRALVSNKVTVIVPAYNEDWHAVDRTVTSAKVAGATQIIVVDDGSVPVMKPVKHVLNLRHPHNRGISAALNTGIKAATGDWVCWLSAGDTMYPNKIRVQLHYTTGLASFHEYVRESDNVTVRPLDRWSTRIYSDNQFCGSTFMVARKVLERIGGFDESLRWCQDWDLAVRVQATVGWQYVEKVLGTGSGIPGHSNVTGQREKERWADRARVADRARALQRMNDEDRAKTACIVQ